MNEGLRWVSAKLAIFTAVTIVVTLGLASFIGNMRLGSDPYEVTAQFADATGLLQGDTVKAAGVTVGRVTEIGIDDGLASVSMSLDSGVRIPAGARASIRFRNLLGQRMISLGEGTSDRAGYLSDGDQIPLQRTDSAFDLSALFNGLRPLIRSTSPEDINIVTREVTKALAGRGTQIESLLGNLDQVSEMLLSKDRALDSLLDGFSTVSGELASRDADLRRSFANLNELLRVLAANKDELSAALVSLDTAAVKLERIVAANDSHIRAEVRDLATILDAVNDRRADLRRALRALPGMLVATERAASYGQWSNIHLIHACKDDLGTCGRRAAP